MEKIEKDPSCKYKKLKLDYTYALDTIYDRAEIEKKKQDVVWSREYECQYSGNQGNVFTKYVRDKATQNNDLIKDIPPVFQTPYCVGIDPGFGSSATGIVMTEHLQNPDIVRVFYAEEIRNANPTDIIINSIENIGLIYAISRW